MKTKTFIIAATLAFTGLSSRNTKKLIKKLSTMNNQLKTFSIAVFITAITLSTASAKVWIVDNNPANISDFTTLQAAHDSVPAGDTLYVHGSGVSYGNLTLTKTLYIFGTGYFLPENPETQAYTFPAKAGQISFLTGSEGTVLTGFHLSIISIGTNNIIIKRNFIEYLFSLCAINIYSSASNVIIIQNYIFSPGDDCICIASGSLNIIIKNNYMEGSYAIKMQTASTTSADIRNNVIFDVWSTVENSVFYNNIISGSVTFWNSNDIQNNISSSTLLGTANQENVDMNTVFDSTITSTDGQWKLAIGSPAIGAGITGEDCGMYGGNEPYVLSGLPAIPAIWFFNAPFSGSQSQGLPVHIKAKSHN